MKYPELDKINNLLGDVKRVVIMQADNPDGDSLGSALALEQILGDLGKEPILYCGVDIPTYLHYVDGWDRVQKDIPAQFDASIIVDISAESLFGNLDKSGQRGWVASRPCLVIDHHNVESSIPFATIICNYPAVATGEVVYELAQQLNWPLNQAAKELLTTAILSDSLGLTSEATSSRSIHIIGELVEGGVTIAVLEQKRRELMRKTPEILTYKGQLLQRVEYFADGRLACITIPWEEIEKYSQAYNPSMLVIDDMRNVEGVDVAIAFKKYQGGRITGKIRCNIGKGIGGDLAAHFGGGGHSYASGFKVEDGRSFEEVKAECVKVATELLAKVENKKNETL